MSQKKHKAKELLNPVTLESPIPFALRVVYLTGSLLTLGVIFCLAFFPMRSDDIFMYLAIGKKFFATNSFPETDPFLFSLSNYNWHILHEWGTYLLAYKLFIWGGWQALVAAKTLLILLAASTALFLALKLKYHSPIVLLIVLAAGYAACPRFIERASLFSDIFTAVTLSLILSWQLKAHKAIYALPLIFLLWANLHPGFHVGLMLLALTLIVKFPERKQKGYQRLAWCSLASLIACCCNPAFVKGFLFPLASVFDRSWQVYRQYNFEWMPTLNPGYAGTPSVWVFLLLIAAIAYWLYLARQFRPWLEFTCFLFLSYLGLSAIRFVPTATFALAVLGVYLSARLKLLDLKLPKARKTASGVTYFTMVIALGIILKLSFSGYQVFSGPRHAGWGLDTEFQPTRAAEFLEKLPLKVNLFNQHDFGSYLAWRWDGKIKLFYHGFVDDLKFYAKDYLGVNKSQEDFDRITNKYDIGAFLLTRYDLRNPRLPLIYRMLLLNPAWHLVYMDDVAMVFLKDLPANREAITKYKLSPY